VGADRRNIFHELLDRVLVLELRTTAVRTGTELDLKELIDLLRLGSASARMSALAPRPLGCQGTFLGVATERSSLAVRGALGLFELRPPRSKKISARNGKKTKQDRTKRRKVLV
jgi:hypothetical protein